MSETIIRTEALPEVLAKLIQTEQVCVCETKGIIQIIPIKPEADCTAGLRGLFADPSGNAVEQFLERKQKDKELLK